MIHCRAQVRDAQFPGGVLCPQSDTGRAPEVSKFDEEKRSSGAHGPRVVSRVGRMLQRRARAQDLQTNFSRTNRIHGSCHEDRRQRRFDGIVVQRPVEQACGERTQRDNFHRGLEGHFREAGEEEGCPEGGIVEVGIPSRYRCITYNYDA